MAHAVIDISHIEIGHRLTIFRTHAVGLLVHQFHLTECLIVLAGEMIGAHQHVPCLHLLTHHAVLLAEGHHVVRKVEDGVIYRHIEIIEDAIHTGLSLAGSITLTTGFCLPFVKASQLELEVANQEALVIDFLHGIQLLLTFLMRHHLTQRVHCMLRSDCC